MGDTFDAIPPQQWGRAKSLRRHSTWAERRLWRALRDNQLGVHFRRQHPIGPYFADFYCWDAHLVVELDGDTHATDGAVQHDEARTEFLRVQGLVVRRYTNRDVMQNLDGVILDLRTYLDSVKR